MCTMLSHHAAIEGCGKGKLQDWFELRELRVSYDCPFHIRLEHALNIDFVNEAEGPSARVAVELTPASARELARAIMETLAHAEEDGWLDEHGEALHEHPEVAHAH